MKKLLISLLLLVAIGANAQNADSINLYPNPYSTQICLEFDLDHADTVTWSIFDRWGRLVYQPYNHVYLDSGHYKNCLVNDSLKDGVYYHKVDLGSRAKTFFVNKVSNGSEILTIAEKNSKLFAFPNPLTDVLILSEKLASISIMDITGRKVLERSFPPIRIDVSGLTPGVYLVSGKTMDHRIFSQKMEKQ